LTSKILFVNIINSAWNWTRLAMQGPVLKAIPATLLFVVAHLLTWPVAAADDNNYEIPQELKAAEILPSGLLEGEHHSVDDRVRSDGYLNYYTITSDYGAFEAISTATLRIRIGEINALAELDELSRTEVFIKAAAEAGIVAPLKSVKQIVTHPIKTVFGIPRGIGRMFKRYTRQASDAVESTKEAVASDDDSDAEGDEKEDDSNVAVDLTESYFGVSGAERAWAQKLGTDPYSSNEILRTAIKEVAWAERLGKFGVAFAGLPEIPGADIIGGVNKAVWSKDPYELQDLNRARLTAAGADEESIKKFLDNPRMSPTQQTLLTAAIAELTDVEGRAGILSRSLIAKTDAEVRFFVRSVALLAWYHLNQSSIVSVTTDTLIPGGLTEDGKAAMLFAVDHLYWTEEVARADDVFAGLGAPTSNISREVWLLGTASERCRTELSAIGWDVHENLAQTLASVE
jgi:hypothetical protein